MTTEQQARSHLLAQLFRRRFIGFGEDEVDDGAVILPNYVGEEGLRCKTSIARRFDSTPRLRLT